jgi:hypothetical protein
MPDVVVNPVILPFLTTPLCTNNYAFAIVRFTATIESLGCHATASLAG